MSLNKYDSIVPPFANIVLSQALPHNFILAWQNNFLHLKDTLQ